MVRLVLFQLRMLPDMIQYVDYHCTLLQPLNTVLPPFLAEFSKYMVKQSSAGRNPGFSQNHVEQGSRRKPRPRGNGVAGQLVSGHPFSKIKVVDMTKTNTVESLCFVSDLSCWQG